MTRALDELNGMVLNLIPKRQKGPTDRDTDRRSRESVFGLLTKNHHGTHWSRHVWNLLFVRMQEKNRECQVNINIVVCLSDQPSD